MSVGFGVWRYLLKRETVIKNNLRFENLAYIEDRLFQLDLFGVVNRVSHAEIVLYYYVQHNDSIMHSGKKNFGKYVPWLWTYIERLTGLINDLDIPDSAIIVLEGQRNFAIISLLGSSIKYCPVSVTKDALAKLKTIDGAYPMQIIGVRSWIRTARRLMNHSHLWLFLCRIFHIIPSSVRQKL